MKYLSTNFTKKNILIHLGSMILVGTLILTGTFWYLDFYTNHNSELIEVGSIEGMDVQEALDFLEQAGLEGIVSDTVYEDGAKKLAIIKQNPEPGMKVKPGRKVYLVMNIDKLPQVKMPDLANKTSLIQAENILKRSRLKVGKILKVESPFVRSASDQPVLAQYYAGTKNPILPGIRIDIHSNIDLEVGAWIQTGSDSLLYTDDYNFN